MTFPPGLAPIALAVEATLFSAYVRGLKPLSLFLIAPVGSGKTELLSCYAHNKGIRLFNDFTAYGLCSTLNEVKAGIVRHILIPDVLRLTARSSTVRRQILATLNSLTEEGITRIETFNIRFSSMQPVRAGVIAAITTDEWRARRRSWMRIGFLSRAIPISYTLAPEDILRGEELIYSGKEAFKPIDLIFPEEPVDVEIPLNMKDKLKRIAYALAAVNRDETRFRSHKHVIAMTKSLALRAGRRSVVDEDIAVIGYDIKFEPRARG